MSSATTIPSCPLNSSSVTVSTRLPSTNSVTLAYLLRYALTGRRVVLEFPPERQVLIVQCRQHTPGLDRHPLEVQHSVPRLDGRSEEHTSELQSRENLVCRLLLEKKNHNIQSNLFG